MKSPDRIKIYPYLFLLLCLAGVVILFSIRRPDQPIPAREIVYIKRLTNSQSLAFAHPDGSGTEIMSGLDPWYNVSWSPSGTYLAYRRPPPFSSPGGYLALIAASGKTYHCSNLEMSYGAIRFITDTQIGIIEKKENIDEIVRFDLLECQKKAVLFTSQPGERITDFDLSSQGWLAVQFDNSEDELFGVRILNGKQLISEILFMRYPFWSKDGEYLALSYLIDEDSYRLAISDKTGKEIHRYPVPITDYYEQCFAWSPDNQFILYYENLNVKKLVVSTGEVSLFCEICLSPSWREIPATP